MAMASLASLGSPLTSTTPENKKSIEPTDYILEFKLSDDIHKGFMYSIIDMLRENGFGVTKKTASTGDIVFVKVRASFPKLMENAERMRLQKQLKTGRFSNFTVAKHESFEGIENPQKFFSSTERTLLVWDAMENIKATKTKGTLGGIVNPGRSIINKCLSESIIESAFPLHQRKDKTKLHQEWVSKFWTDQPLDLIRDYFGEKIGLYFAWLGFYTAWLSFPAIMGLLLAIYQYFYELDNLFVPLYSISTSIWSMFFLEFWKRENARIAYRWHVLNLEDVEAERPEFYGESYHNPITGQDELKYPAYKRSLKYLVSVPVIGFMYCVSVFTYLATDYFKDHVNTDIHWTMEYVPMVTYSALVPIINMIFQSVAHRLNDWENHQTNTEHENHLIWKLFLFDFVNSYLSLFHIAFWKRDLELLRQQLAALLVTRQVVDNIQETVVPWVIAKFRQRKLVDVIHKGDKKKVIPKIEAESMLNSYDSTISDYLEMVLQFGYITLFGSAFPLAALAALVNNIFEIRGDAFKLIHNCRRPLPVQAGNIGTWYRVMEMMAYMAVMSNCAFLVLTSDQFNYYYPDINFAGEIFIFVVIEHLVIAFRIFISQAIDDIPKDIRDCLRRDRMEREQAFVQQMEAQNHSTLAVMSATSAASVSSKTPSPVQNLNSEDSSSASPKPSAAGIADTPSMSSTPGLKRRKGREPRNVSFNRQEE